MKGKLVKMEDIKDKATELVNKAESELKEQYKKDKKLSYQIT